MRDRFLSAVYAVGIIFAFSMIMSRANGQTAEVLLQRNGLALIEMNGYQIRGCDGQFLVPQFKARSPSGAEISGLVCKGGAYDFYLTFSG